MSATRFDRSLMITLSLLLVAVLAMGCLLYPMSDPEKSVMDHRLLGTWVHKNEAFVFMPHDKRTYTMLILKKKENKWVVDESSEMGYVQKAFITKAGNDTYLNIQFMVHQFVYNKELMTVNDLDKIAKASQVNNKEKDKAADAMTKQRIAISKSQAQANGIAPMFLVAKIKIEKDQLNFQILKAPDADEKEYASLKSMDEVRDYVIKKGQFDEAKVYTFKNWAREAK